mmetsp:Transcript_27867/g.81589  ORF Transcript_27867/g.81589 Transcript_27867/m.81589 type:complete len:120 (-) Transcript_27867:2-361(-)
MALAQVSSQTRRSLKAQKKPPSRLESCAPRWVAGDGSCFSSLDGTGVKGRRSDPQHQQQRGHQQQQGHHHHHQQQHHPSNKKEEARRGQFDLGKDRKKWVCWVSRSRGVGAHEEVGAFF